jgi:hypothetical protein
VHRWDYDELVEVIDAKTGKHTWPFHRRKMVWSIGEINKKAEAGWELVTAYSVVLSGKTEVHYIPRRGTLL